MKKGFTLIELLAVVVVLGIISTIAILAVSNTVKKSKSRLWDVQVETIKEKAKMYINDNPTKFNEFLEGETCVNIQDLIDGEYFDNNSIINPYTKENFVGSIRAIKENNQYYYDYYEYGCE